jgi:hypothetical protein
LPSGAAPISTGPGSHRLDRASLAWRASPGLSRDIPSPMQQKYRLARAAFQLQALNDLRDDGMV